MTQTEGVDYAFHRPSINGLVAIGKHFACRYVGPGSSDKHLTPAEAADLSTHGLSIVANAEGTADGLLAGASAGTSWATSAHRHAVACGMPPDRPIYLSVDFDVTESQWSRIAAALRAAGQVLGPDRVGIYGGYDAIAWAARDKVARWFWQTYAWSQSRWHPLAHIRQYRNGVSLVGGTVDLNTAMVADYGQWTVGQRPTEPEDDMPIHPQVLHDLVWRIEGLAKGDNPIVIPALDGGLPERSVPNKIAVRVEAALAAIQRLDDDTDVALIAGTMTEVRGLLTEIRNAPMIDAVAVAAAIGNSPDLVNALASQVAARLSGIEGAITLTGSLSGGITRPAP